MALTVSGLLWLEHFLFSVTCKNLRRPNFSQQLLGMHDALEYYQALTNFQIHLGLI